VASTYLTMILEDKQKSEGLRKRLENQLQLGIDDAKKYDRLKDKTNWTSGKLCLNGVFCLSKPPVLARAVETNNAIEGKK
jgi:hypothetical protein